MNLTELMKQAGQMQARMADMQAMLENVLVTGQAGGGMVKVTMTARFTVRSVAIEPSLLQASEKDMLEDLLLTALADAKTKAETTGAAHMKALTAGLPLPPGMKLPFAL